MPQALEGIEYRAASAKGTARHLRGGLSVRLVDAQEDARIEIRRSGAQRPHRIPVSRLIALTVGGERHPIGAAPDDMLARAAEIRGLLGEIVPEAPPATVTIENDTPPSVSVYAHRPAPVAQPQPLARQAVVTRGGTSAALVPERAYGCLLLAMGAISLLEVLLLVLIKLN